MAIESKPQRPGTKVGPNQNHLLAALPDAERIEVLQAAGAAFRRIEATVVETIATGDAVDFPHSTGCRTQNELLQRTLLTDLRGATRVAKVVALVRREVSLASGDRLPARWPALREAMLDELIEQSPERVDTALEASAAALYLEQRQRAHTALRAQGATVLDVTAVELPGALVDHYLAMKRAGRL